MSTSGRDGTAARILLKSRLAYHLRCLREDATNPDLTALEGVALVRERARRMRAIRETLGRQQASGGKVP